MRNYYQMHKKSVEKKHLKDIKIFLKKKNKKRQTKAGDRHQFFEEEEKEKARQYHRERSKNLFKK